MQFWETVSAALLPPLRDCRWQRTVDGCCTVRHVAGCDRTNNGVVSTVGAFSVSAVGRRRTSLCSNSNRNSIGLAFVNRLINDDKYREPYTTELLGLRNIVLSHLKRCSEIPSVGPLLSDGR